MKHLALSCWFVLLSWVGTDSAQAQMQWWPTEVSATSGVWVAEGDMQDVVESAAFGAHVGWMTRATNGWAAFFGGVEHGGFVGMHRIGSSQYGWQPQLGWTLRTGQTRLVGWSFSTGLAYNSRVYNPEEPNPDLIAVGSHLNGLIRLGITVANDSPISLGLGILHTSNGGLRRPNKGINTPHAKLIVRVAETPRRKVYMDGADPRQWRHAVGLGIGGRDHGAYGGHIYGVQELLPSPRTCCRLGTGSPPKRPLCTTVHCAQTTTPMLRQTAWPRTRWTGCSQG